MQVAHAQQECPVGVAVAKVLLADLVSVRAAAEGAALAAQDHRADAHILRDFPEGLGQRGVKRVVQQVLLLRPVEPQPLDRSDPLAEQDLRHLAHLLRQDLVSDFHGLHGATRTAPAEAAAILPSSPGGGGGRFRTSTSC